MDGIIIFCGKYLIVISVLTTIYLFFSIDKKIRKSFAYQLILGGVLALVFARIATRIYQDPRPFISDGTKALYESSTNNGFPSDHTLLASFLAFSCLIYSKKIGAIMLVIAALVAWGRVAGGVHHGADVLASFAISAAAVWLAKFILSKYSAKPQSRSHPEEGNKN